MKIGELITKLNGIVKDHGDLLDVKITVYDKKGSCYPDAYCDIIPRNETTFQDNIAWGEVRLRIQLPQSLKIIKSKITI